LEDKLERQLSLGLKQPNRTKLISKYVRFLHLTITPSVVLLLMKKGKPTKMQVMPNVLKVSQAVSK